MSRLIGFAALAAMAMPGAALAQDHAPRNAPARTAPAFDPKTTIEAVRAAIRANYVLPAMRAPLDAALVKGLASGRYAVAGPDVLAQRVTEDMAAVAHDKHLNLRFDPGMAAELKPSGQDDEAEQTPFFKAMARRHNHGISELQVLDGNIRMMRYDGFVWTGDESRAAIDQAMAFLRGGDAIVIDIRGNGGGSPDAVRRITSYFVPAGTKLVTFHMRSDPPTVSTSEAVPGGQITGVPVYVLTSGRSASAAEEFASHVAKQKFGTLVGETTAGAGYRNDMFPVTGGFVLSVSVGRPELPDGTDWEGKGVAPALAVPVDLALARAEQAALEALAGKAQGPEKTELEWAAAVQGAKLTPVKPARPLTAYAGRYGPRSVTVEGDGLTYQRDGGIKTALLPLGGDLFALELDPRSRVRFTIAGGAATGFTIEHADGSTIDQPKGEAAPPPAG